MHIKHTIVSSVTFYTHQYNFEKKETMNVSLMENIFSTTYNKVHTTIHKQYTYKTIPIQVKIHVLLLHKQYIALA